MSTSAVIAATHESKIHFSPYFDMRGNEVFVICVALNLGAIAFALL